MRVKITRLYRGSKGSSREHIVFAELRNLGGDLLMVAPAEMVLDRIEERHWELILCDGRKEECDHVL